MAEVTFTALLKTDPHKAYDYGKVMLVTSTYCEPAPWVISENIETYSDKLKLPAEIYQLAALAYQVEIDQSIIFPEIASLPKLYDKMAASYCRANDKLNAIDAQQKAIEALKSKKYYISRTDNLAAFESKLQQYKNM
jgi:hypothetical protein